MQGPTYTARLRVCLPVIAMTGVGGALRFYELGSSSLWHDETYTVRFARQSLHELWFGVQIWEPTPPLYYTLQKLWLVFGDGETAVRALSAVLGTATIPLIYLVGRALSGHRLGLIASLLLATSGVHVQYGQEARAYTLLCLAALVSLWALVRLLGDPATARRPLGQEYWYRAGLLLAGAGLVANEWVLAAMFSSDGALEPVTRAAIWGFDLVSIGVGVALIRYGRPRPMQSELGADLLWLAYIAGILVVLYSHNTAVLLPVLANAVVLIWWVGAGRAHRGFLWNWLAANTIVFLAWTWWLPVFVSQARDLPAHFPEVYNPGLSDAAWILVGVYGQAFVPRPDGCQAPNPMNTLVYDCADWTPWAQLGVSAFIWAIALLGVWHWRRSPMKLAMTTTFAIGVPLLTFAISRWTPIYLGRTLLWPTPLLMILIAAGLLSVHRRVLRFSLLGLVVGIQLYGTINYYRDFEKDSWVDAASYLAARASRSSDIVLLYPRETITTPFLHYFHDEMPMFPQEGISPEDILQGGQLPETVFSFDRIWLVSTADDMPEAREFVRSRLAGTMSEAEYIHLEGAKQIALFRRTDSRPR